MKHLLKSFLRWKRVSLSTSVLLGLSLLLPLAAAHGQGFGSISGTVTDPTGAAIPNAAVVATQTDNGRQTTVTTNSTGNFTFPTLLPAHYSLRISAAGFETNMQKDLVLEANQAVSADAKLTIGAENTTVTVDTAPPQIDTTTGTLSEVIDRQRVLDLPLSGRNTAALVLLVAGVSDATNEGNGVNQGNGKTFPNPIVITSNGTLPNQDNFLLDGGNNVDEMTNVSAPFPMPDATQEFSVQTSNYSAEFGQSAGSVVNIVTKAGGSSFHGSAFEFVRNPFFNAVSYFSTPASDTQHRHQFGGTIGGPVIIPGVSKGKSTQFFFGYQHTLIHNAGSATTTVPTLAEEGRTNLGYADLSNLCSAGFNGAGICASASQQVLNPFNNVAYAYNHIPASDFDAAAAKLQQSFPTYSGTEAAGKIGGLVTFKKPSDQTFDEYTARVDHDFGSHDHLFGRYFYDWYTQAGIYDPTNLASYQSYFNTRYQNALLSETHVFTSNLLNNLIVNYQREVSLRGGPPGSPLITDFGVKNIWQPNTGPFLSASVSGYFAASSSAFAGWGRNNYTFDDSVRWVKGNHNFAFGGHVELSKFDVTNVFQSYGAFSFGAVTNKIGSTTYQYPNAYANYLLGFMNSFQQGNYELVNDRNHFPGFYAQDSWKATTRLQINYGIRWEAFAPWANRIGQSQQFNPTAYTQNRKTSLYSTLPAGLLLSGDQGVPQNGVNNKYKQFMPRVGFAYDVFGDGKMSVRGGYGLFFQDRLPGFFNLSQASFVPDTISVALTDPGMAGATAGVNPGGPFSNPYCTGCATGAYANPFPFTLPFASTQTFPNAFQVATFDPSGNFQIPYTMDYNLIVERQLMKDWSARVAYVGSGSRHQFVNLEINPSVNNGSGLSTNQRRVYNSAPTVGPCVTTAACTTSYSNIIDGALIGNTHYNSLQASLQKKMSHGLSVTVNYTYSRSYDDLPQATRVSNTEDFNAGESYVYPLYPTNATNVPAAAYVSDIKALDRGPSDIDHPNVFSASYVWEFPHLHAGSSFAKYVVNGWRTTGLITHRSGDALTAFMGSDVSLTGLSQDRAVRDFTKPAYSSSANNQGDCSAGARCVNWLNSQAFSVPVNTGVGTGFGNVQKGSLRGPAQTDWDASMIRVFPVWRETNIEFRAEYFNVLNHTQFSNPNTTNPATSSTSFGTITSVLNSARTAQFGAKFNF